MRPSRDEMLYQLCEVVARRSTCLRLQVGAVLSLNGRVLMTGYNGAPPSLPHCTPATCNRDHPCTNTAHAESNVIAYAARCGVSILGSTLHVTNSPCEACAKLVLTAGIKEVHFWEPYRVLTGVHLLTEGGVECFHQHFSTKATG